MTYNNWYHAMKRAQPSATKDIAGPAKRRLIKAAVRAVFLKAFPEHQEQHAAHMEMRAEDMRNP